MIPKIRVRVWGPYALFSRPELKVERYSYDVLTPSAARGILEAIYWHPGMRYVIDRICVVNPIVRTSVRRNEIKTKVSNKQALQVMNKQKNTDLSINRKDHIVQRNNNMLEDVEYIIECHFEMTDQAKESDNPGKFADIIHRRLKRGSCYKAPYLGTRECGASFEEFKGDLESVNGFYQDLPEKDFGLMLYDLDYSQDEISPMFYRAIMKNGIIDVSGSEVLR